MTIIHADLLKWLRDNQWQAQHGYLPKAHAVFADPPYGLEFMAQNWDKHASPQDFQAWVTEWASLLIDFVHPGGLLAMFGGTRTYHRLAAGLEDAGWEVFDCMMYVYGSGFPKSHNISKAIDAAAGAEREVVGFGNGGLSHNHNLNDDGWYAAGDLQHRNAITAPATDAARQWDGWGTSLKPSYEPCVLARAPRGTATYAELAQTWGTGALNVDAGRIGTDEHLGRPQTDQRFFKGLKNNGYNDNSGGLGRYPANLILDDVAGAALDAMSGESAASYRPPSSRQRNNGVGLGTDERRDGMSNAPDNYGDSGGASRFFYTAKAPAWEREAGLGEFALGIGGGMGGTLDQSLLTGSGNIRNNLRRNIHPTVKPIQLTEYIARLLLPPVLDVPRRLLVPFAGVGSEMIGATLAGWDDVTGIEMTAEYIPINEARRKWWAQFQTYAQAQMAYRPALEQSLAIHQGLRSSV